MQAFEGLHFFLPQTSPSTTPQRLEDMASQNEALSAGHGEGRLALLLSSRAAWVNR